MTNKYTFEKWCEHLLQIGRNTGETWCREETGRGQWKNRRLLWKSGGLARVRYTSCANTEHSACTRKFNNVIWCGWTTKQAVKNAGTIRGANLPCIQGLTCPQSGTSQEPVRYHRCRSITSWMSQPVPTSPLCVSTQPDKRFFPQAISLMNPYFSHAVLMTPKHTYFSHRLLLKCNSSLF